jgi:hypothetical protein
MTCRIEQLVVQGAVTLHLSGQIIGKDVDLLRSLLEQEASAVVIDLQSVRLVDREAIGLLALRESKGDELRNCPAYVREWVTREEANKNASQGGGASEDSENA